MTKTANYRNDILEICERYARAGEDWETSLLSGAPSVIDAEEADALADWLDGEVNSVWNPDHRYEIIAEEIRKLIPK